MLIQGLPQRCQGSHIAQKDLVSRPQVHTCFKITQFAASSPSQKRAKLYINMEHFSLCGLKLLKAKVYLSLIHRAHTSAILLSLCEVNVNHVSNSFSVVPGLLMRKIFFFDRKWLCFSVFVFLVFF